MQPVKHGVMGKLPFHEAAEWILRAAKPLEPEDVPLAQALGRSLAREVQSAVDMPGFDNSAVDGYAVRFPADAGGFRVVGRVEAGEDPAALHLMPGEAARVFTGAPIPVGTEAVAMQEDCDCSEHRVVLLTEVGPGANIRIRAEEICAGDVIASAGDLVIPPLLALCASAGSSSLAVHRLPRVGILSTGTELVAPGSPLALGQVYRSNSVGLAAALTAMHIAEVQQVHVLDEAEATRDAIVHLLTISDVLIVSGGVSVGERDFVKSSLEEAGVKREFWGVAMKPGQPFFFGTKGKQLVFGLPGNPVSALVTFFLLARPAILRLMGLSLTPEGFRARLGSGMSKKKGRTEFVRGVTRREGCELWVDPSTARGSHMMGGLAAADSLIHFPAADDILDRGAVVELTLLKWSLS